MYQQFFGLQLLPFNNTPDPRFFFNTPDHEEALAALLYATQERKGFVLVTGEVGAGKTLLTRVALERFESGIQTATLHNTRLNGRELLLAVCREFEISVAPDSSSSDLSSVLETYLLEQYQRGAIVAIIIDEAQNLSPEAFEELRLLGNLEADDAKLVQVLILGQPELQSTFRLPQMRQIEQRLFRRFHLKALTRELTSAYVKHRLSVAGCKEKRPLFDEKSLDVIYEFSEGIPRLINHLCDNVLLSAYADSVKKLTPEFVREVSRQMLSKDAEVGYVAGAIKPNARAKRGTRREDVALKQVNDEQKLEVIEFQERVQAIGQRLEALGGEAEQSIQKSVEGFLNSLHGIQDQIESKRRESFDAASRAQQSLNEARDEAILRLKVDNEEPDELLRETRELLTQTRIKSAELLNDLRAEIGRQKQKAEETWQHSVVEGGRTMVETIQELLDARKSAEDAATDSRKMLAEMTRQLTDTKSEIERLFESRQFEMRSLSAESSAIKSDLQAHLESARERLEKNLCEHEESLQAHAQELASAAKKSIDQSSAQAAGQVEILQSTLKTATVDFERLNVSMQDTIAELKKDGKQCREEYGHSAAAMRRERAEILQDLQNGIQKYAEQADTIEEQLADMLERGLSQLSQNQLIADETIDQVRQVSGAIKDQCKRSVQEVRSTLGQIQEAAVLAKADVRIMGEDLRQTTADATQTIEAAAVRVQVQATTAVENAHDMVQQAQQTATSLLANANVAFEKSKLEAEQMEARFAMDAAEQFASHKKDADRMLAQMRELHGNSMTDLASMKAFMSEAREEVMTLSNNAKQYNDQVLAAHAEIKQQGDHILAEAKSLEGRSRELLMQHLKLADEAQSRTDAIVQMSRTLATVLKQLQTAGSAAQAHYDKLSVENQGAEQRLSQMRQHSQRLGQLVGIIRQVYGTIDARVEGLRYGLAQAEQFAKTDVPKVSGGNGKRPVPVTPPKNNVVPAKPTSGSLGDIVSRNQKLNAWLQDVLKEESTPAAATPKVNRVMNDVMSKAS